jgi:hypothetical protein
MSQTNEQRWAEWLARYPGADKQREGLSWWNTRPVSYDSAKWLASLDDDEREKVQQATRHQRGALSTGVGSAPHKAG